LLIITAREAYTRQSKATIVEKKVRGLGEKKGLPRFRSRELSRTRREKWDTLGRVPKI